MRERKGGRNCEGEGDKTNSISGIFKLSSVTHLLPVDDQHKSTYPYEVCVSSNNVRVCVLTSCVCVCVNLGCVCVNLGCVCVFQNMSDAMAVLPKLSTGLDVNVRFTGVTDFEYTPECIVFDLLNIPLYHGWLVDPQVRAFTIRVLLRDFHNKSPTTSIFPFNSRFLSFHSKCRLE